LPARQDHEIRGRPADRCFRIRARCQRRLRRHRSRRLADVRPGNGTARYVDNTVEMTINMKPGPLTNLDRTAPDEGPATESNGFACQCTEDTLTVQGIYDLNYRQSTYTRRVSRRHSARIVLFEVRSTVSIGPPSRNMAVREDFVSTSRGD
jgi:hypothetical protein